MHQPLYKDRLTGHYLMPWVRLHAIKDYLDMVEILDDFPKIRQTFNLVPSLIEQIEDYAHQNAVDEQLLLTCKAPTAYTDADKLYLLTESFHANYDRQIAVHPQYLRLYEKRAACIEAGHSFEHITHDFTNQEFADMATWMNLAWFDPFWRDRISGLKELIAQGSNFTIEQRQSVIEMQRALMRRILPVYKAQQDKGQIEVTTTPYYHPILPLLIDSNAAKLSNPECSLPKKLYFHREDAIHHLEAGLQSYEKAMGRKTRGMWPSEMACSPAALELIANTGVNWVVLDEAILSRTTSNYIFRDEHGNLNSAEILCQPYDFFVGNQKVTIFFREVVLSNELSFSYGSRGVTEAATAMYMRLKHIQQKLFNWDREGVIVIALDGENCWETYELDGNPFLRELYRRLSEDSTFNVCTVSDYLERNPPTAKLYNVHSGSWIGADFHIWIGDPYKNKAWDLLGETRNFLVEYLKINSVAEDTQKKAWEEIYAAEGSDWFWWFGEPNNSAHDSVFDQQFRLRLTNVYTLLGEKYPVELDMSVSELVRAEMPPVVVVS
jgi:alpha-amylase/alpha-mannosidase (GH57 family)